MKLINLLGNLHETEEAIPTYDTVYYSQYLILINYW